MPLLIEADSTLFSAAIILLALRYFHWLPPDIDTPLASFQLPTLFRLPFHAD